MATQTLDDLPTPALILDRAILSRNLKRMSERMAKAGRKTVARAAAKKAAPVRPAEPEDPVRALVDGLPELAAGNAVELNEVVKALRDAKLLGRSASGPKFLAKHAPYLELSPANQPNKVRLKAGAHH